MHRNKLRGPDECIMRVNPLVDFDFMLAVRTFRQFAYVKAQAPARSAALSLSTFGHIRLLQRGQTFALRINRCFGGVVQDCDLQLCCPRARDRLSAEPSDVRHRLHAPDFRSSDRNQTLAAGVDGSVLSYATSGAGHFSMRSFLFLMSLCGLLWGADAILFDGKYLASIHQQADALNRSLQRSFGHQIEEWGEYLKPKPR